MTNTDRSVVVAALAAAILVAGCAGRRTRTGQEAGVPAPADGSLDPERPIEPDRPVAPDADVRDLAAPVEAPADRAQEVSPPDLRAEAAVPPPDRMGGGDEPMACALARPIISPICNRCLVARCCEQARPCDMVQLSPVGGGGRAGCDGALYCARRCPDGGGACRVEASTFSMAAACSNGVGPGGATILIDLLTCASDRCAYECAQDP